MFTPTTTADEGSIEECVDELNELVSQLDRYSPLVLALALRVHLESLLRALVQAGRWSQQDAQEFVSDLARQVLEDDQP